MTTDLGTASPTRVRRRWACLAVLSASVTLIAMENTVLTLALATLSADLRPSAVQQLWIVDAYAVGMAAAIVPMSALADRVGRRRLLILGYALFMIASLLVLSVDSAGQLIALRAALGVAAGTIMPSTLSLLRAVFEDPAARATALGVWTAMWAVGAATGPLLGGLLLEHFSWQSTFLFAVPLMALAVVAGRALLPEVRAADPAPLDLLGSGTAAAGMIAVVWALKEGARHGWLSSSTILTGALGALALAFFVQRCLRSPRPMLELRLLGDRGFLAANLTLALAMLSMGPALLLLPQWFELVQGRGTLEIGLLLVPLAAGTVLLSAISPVAAGRYGVRAVLGGGLALDAVGILALAAPQLSGTLACAGLFLIGCGAGTLSVASALLMARARSFHTTAAAMENISYEVGSIAAMAAFGSLALSSYRSGLAAVDSPGAVIGESLGADLAQARASGVEGLATVAADSFTQALQVTGLAAAATVAAGAVLVALLVPRAQTLADAPL